MTNCRTLKLKAQDGKYRSTDVCDIEGIIQEYSTKLTNELGKGYSQRNLRNMRQFYQVSQKWQTLSAKLSWSHFRELLQENMN